MFGQLVIGSIMICITIFIHTGFFFAAQAGVQKLPESTWSLSHAGRYRLVLVATALWFVAAHTVEVWLWAGVYLLVGALQTFEAAMYFTLVSFTTLGFGDVILTPEHRLLSGMTAINGLILFGLTTAYLVEISRSMATGKR